MGKIFDGNQIDIIEVFKKLFFFKKDLLIGTGLFTLCILVATLFLSNYYEATVTLLPQNDTDNVSKFSNLAAIAGIDLSSTSVNTENLYGDLIKSDQILDKVIKKQWQFGDDRSYGYLYDLLKIKLNKNHSNPKFKRDFETKKYLRENAISFKTSKDNGLMIISVVLPEEPSLVAEIANYIVEELSKFNETYRQLKAKTNLESIENQLTDAKSELNDAEENLKKFKNKNIKYDSPELQLEFNRLEREVITENSVYTEVRKQYELAKIDLVRSKQTIIILDSAVVPVEKSRPNRLLIIISLGLLVFVLDALYILVFK